MNPAVKEKWLTALRSGEFTQARGALIGEDGGYCCLGVLCVVALAEGVDIRRVAGDFVYDDEGVEIDSYGELPTPVQTWAGLDASGTIPLPIPMDEYTEPARALTTLNDDARYDFEQIADVIEAQL